METGDWVRVNAPWSAYGDWVGRVSRTEGNDVWVVFKGPDEREFKFEASSLVKLADRMPLETGV